ncbi:MAG: CsgG/HfaB family protein [Candidatus Omnitrophica bacterium]|nr:CsgG/HfaB family protein [Candidatus Omnitrophota bacterium]
MMKKIFSIVGCMVFVFSIVGCVSLKSLVELPKKIHSKIVSSPYSGPKAKITVADFSVVSPKATSQTGVSLRDLLIVALNKSNRFLIIERQEPSAVKTKKESSTDASMAVSDTNKPKADLVIAITVKEFEPQASGGSAGIGGGGGAESGAFGGLLGSSFSKAHIALDIRIVDAATSKTLVNKSVQGQASDIGGDLMSGSAETRALGTGLSVYANTPMEKAMRICIMEAVRYISATVPESYYKYGKT